MRRYTVTVDDRTFTIDVSETAADRFEVSVGGRTFEATLEGDEDLPGAAISPEMVVADESRPASLPPPAVARPAGPSATATTAAPVPARSPAAPAPGDPPASSPTHPSGSGSRLDTLSAPMPGVVLEVLVRPGAVLRRGDPILVLEAMKMRNTIRAPRPATVVEVSVEAGQPVGPGQPLARLAPSSG